jgi:hypothetical protein
MQGFKKASFQKGKPSRRQTFKEASLKKARLQGASF